MTTSAAVLEEQSALVGLLDEQFAPSRLSGLLGSEGANVRWQLWDEALYGPLRDFLSRPGKEFRGRLVEASYRLSGARGPVPEELALIVEVLHAGSLIVDDIEDGSTYRRGSPALHCVYGTAKALNAGNWLYFLPSQLLRRLELGEHEKLALHHAIDDTLLRCHYGQALDLSTKVQSLKQTEVAGVARSVMWLKTGSLMQLATELGARGGAAPPHTREALVTFGKALGIGLQMLDDFGGLACEKRCHKGHEDLLLGRVTWAWALAAEHSDAKTYGELLRMAREVQAGELHPELLTQALLSLIEGSARRAIHDHLAHAFARLEAVCPAGPTLTAIKREVERLEQSYG